MLMQLGPSPLWCTSALLVLMAISAPGLQEIGTGKCTTAERPAPANLTKSDLVEIYALQGFAGVDYQTTEGRGGGPVQFERDAVEADPFGLDQFLTNVEVKEGSKKRRGALDGIGAGGSMRAAGGGSGYVDAGPPSRSRVDFARGRD